MKFRGVIRGAAGAWMLAGAAVPAAAQGGDPQAQLRQLIAEMTELVGRLSEGDATLRTSRAAEIRAEAGGAVATLPDVTIVGRNGNRLELGTLTLSQREAAAGRLRYELALPRSVRGVEPSGAVPFTLTTGGGTLAVVRDAASGLIHELAFSVANLDMPATGRDGVAATIGAFELGWTISGRADGLFDGAARIALRAARAAARSGAGGNVGDASIAFGVQGFRLDDLEQLRATLAGGSDPLPQRWRRTVERLHAIQAAGGMRAMTFDVALADAATGDGGTPPTIAIGRANLNQSFTALDQPNFAAEIRYGHEGLTLRHGMMGFPEYVPERVAIDLALDRLPMRALQALDAATNARGGPGMAALLGVLVQSGAVLRIAPIEVSTPAIGARLNGTVTADGSSPFQAQAQGDLVVRGLDALQRELGGAAGGRGGADSPAAVLGVLAALGQQGTGPDGQPTRSYRIELTQAGQLMLNGADMSALIGAVAGRRATRPPGPAGAPAAPAQRAPAQPAPAPAK